MDGRGALLGLALGLATNLALARLAPGVSWLWWNPAGFAAACAVALVTSRAPLAFPRLTWPRLESAVLIGAFLVMALALAALA